VNLLEERWIPIRRASGLEGRIAPYEITDGIDTDPVMALDAPRPDFNGALIQFLIGLVQTAWVYADRFWDREEMLWSPPTPDELRHLFEPLKEAFYLDGDGPRFMQDLTLCASDKPTQKDVAALLVDFPGAETIGKNTDHFVKRDSGGPLCPHCAAAALFCLMTNAPSGGTGHRTSLRGGGPLTTLIVYVPVTPDHPPRALWRDVSCNVLDASSFVSDSSRNFGLPDLFPWLRGIEQSTGKSGEVQPLDVSPLQVYWAMPRRVRLLFEGGKSAQCALCRMDTVGPIRRCETKNLGLNYKGPWRHPLSPYYRNKLTDPFLPFHPQPDGMAYRHWLGWVLGTKRPGQEIVPAEAVRTFRSALVEPRQLRLWAFGYDMDNMKARCWYETVFPLFDLPVEHHTSLDTAAAEALAGIVGTLILTAEEVAKFIRDAVHDAWTGAGESRGDLGFVEASFWSGTQAQFFSSVEGAIALARHHGRDAYDQSASLRGVWLETLRRAALGLFDQLAARGNVEAGNPVKLARAYRNLCNKLYGRQLQKALGLTPIDQSSSVSRPRSRRRNKTGEQTT
jgi:CRISPR system Cascade subunit CasA